MLKAKYIKYNQSEKARARWKKYYQTHKLQKKRTRQAKANEESKTLIFVADFETTYSNKKEITKLSIEQNKEIEGLDKLVDKIEINNKSQVFLCGLKAFEGNYYLSYEDINELFDNIKTECRLKDKTRARVYFHNLKFDGSYILSQLLKSGYTQTLKKTSYNFPILNGKEFSCLITAGKWFNLTLNWKGIHIEFIDSLKMINASLKNMCKDFKVPLELCKMELDKNEYKKFYLDKTHNYPKLWIDYLKNDCLALEFILQTFFKERPQAKNQPTISSLAFKEIEKVLKTEIEPIKDRETWNWYNNWYHGGLCQVNPHVIGKFMGVQRPGIYMIDKTSMYPSMMVKPLPYGKPQTEQPEGKLGVDWNEMVVFTAKKVKITRTDFPLLPKPRFYNPTTHVFQVNRCDKDLYLKNWEASDNKLKTFFMWRSEVEKVRQVYKITGYQEIDTEHPKYWKLKPYLKEDIERLFVAKQTASRNGEAVLKAIAKLVLNSLYGKTGQKWYRTQDFYGKLEDLPENWEIVGDKVTSSTINNATAYTIHEIKADNDIKFSPVFLASYITMLARVDLFNKYDFVEKNGGLFLYCDTDSIAYYSRKPIEHRDLGDDLGTWAFEDLYQLDGTKKSCQFLPAHAFVGLGSKHYRLVYNDKRCTKPAKIACAGVRKELMERVRTRDYNYDNEELTKTALIMSENGYEIVDNPFTFSKNKGLYPNPIIPSWYKGF